MFNLDNTSGFTQTDCDLMNAALALYIERNSDDETSSDMLAQIEKSGCDLINNNWAESGNTVESLLLRVNPRTAAIERSSATAPTVHRFDSTGDAYDACQCDESVKLGDTLLIESERVVGFADTWPIAVSAAFGHLHTARPDVTDEQLASSTGAAIEAIIAARALAKELGFDVASTADTLTDDVGPTKHIDPPQHAEECPESLADIAGDYFNDFNNPASHHHY